MGNLTKSSPKFNHWLSKVERAGVKIERLEVLAEVSRDGKELFSSFVDTLMVTPEGERQPRCMLIRGESVMIVPWITCDGLDYTLMVEQRRPVEGLLSTEFAGGMMDLEVSDTQGVATKEANEELGLNLTRDQLFSLADEPVKVCTAALDEVVHFYSFNLEVTKAELADLEGRLTGHHGEGEHLKLKVVRLSEVHKIHNYSALAGLKLLEIKAGKVF